jgi:hypothetical protein
MYFLDFKIIFNNVSKNSMLYFINLILIVLNIPVLEDTGKINVLFAFKPKHLNYKIRDSIFLYLAFIYF